MKVCIGFCILAVVGFCILAVAFARQNGCLQHQTFNECGTMCPLTCENYENPPKICGLMCVPGCQCDEGYVLKKDQRCVRKEECSAKTKPDRGVDKFCLAESDPGWCKGSFRRWYYDAQIGTCRMFVYGGCQGNSNRYESKQECLSRCKGVEVKRSMSKSTPNICKAPANSGNCSAYFVRFYFDSTSGQCRRFIYSGCDSNGNNFRSLRECERTCRYPG